MGLLMLKVMAGLPADVLGFICLWGLTVLS